MIVTGAPAVTPRTYVPRRKWGRKKGSDWKKERSGRRHRGGPI